MSAPRVSGLLRSARSRQAAWYLFVCCWFLTMAVGCGARRSPGETPQVDQETATAQASWSVTPAPKQVPVGTPAPPNTLRIWVPPQLDPAADTPAGTLLRNRLAQFSELNGGVKIDVRVKAVEGVGGMLDALTTAGSAAPLVLPDVLALPRPLLEAAALKGLIHPFPETNATLDDPDWYEYARQLGRLQDSTFGLPFAGDALLLAYQPAKVTTPPANWESLLSAGSSLLFPAADPHALFTLALYQSSGGTVQDDQGRPVIDEEILFQVLSLYQLAAQAGLMPYTLTQYETDDQAWAAYAAQEASMVITWSSTYFATIEAAPGSRARLLPTSDGAPFTLATGWMWALAGTDPKRDELGIRLAEFLSASDFLAEWSRAIYALPVRMSATAAWLDVDLQTLADQVGRAAQVLPSSDVLSSLGMPLSRSVAAVLKQQADPLSAAQEAANHLRNP